MTPGQPSRSSSEVGERGDNLQFHNTPRPEYVVDPAFLPDGAPAVSHAEHQQQAYERYAQLLKNLKNAYVMMVSTSATIETILISLAIKFNSRMYGKFWASPMNPVRWQEQVTKTSEKSTSQSNCHKVELNKFGLTTAVLSSVLPRRLNG
ncbi:hypothetical protein HELRODRAFT_178040 [Helobdella robusta]|uniref:Uncharacterized protein n=1 Tax=Helobdella robusta TaxID=6412 RepID=T1FCN5_HELRO|nr:hypothetical protein HELRODRAFT_178040 [Helobdella robusta]ESN97604.1 hypothetical protein HELRODRAFT_178040 [Helobdella robusta]